MAADSKKHQAELQFKKSQQAEQGKKALSEYEAESAAVRTKTARLKALRLARDAAATAAAPAAPAKKSGKKAGGKKAKPGLLTDWLKNQQDSGRNN